jgi:hypothetical protein
MYAVGVFLHILLVANLAVRSKCGGTHTIKEYLTWRWVPISCRIFLSILAFVLVWNNPALIDIDRFMSTASSQMAIAGILGWFSDSVLDKVIGMIPALQKDLPIIPPIGDSSRTVIRKNHAK